MANGPPGGDRRWWFLDIRRYREADIAEVWRLHIVPIQAIGAYRGDGPWDDDLRDIRRFYLESGGEFLVGVHEGTVCAIGGLQRTSADSAEIRRMRVEPGLQGLGFGGIILDALERRAGDLGYSKLQLTTTARQVAAVLFYTKHGYVPVEQTQVGGFPCIRFEKRLAPPVAES